MQNLSRKCAGTAVNARLLRVQVVEIVETYLIDDCSGCQYVPHDRFCRSTPHGHTGTGSIVRLRFTP